MTHRGDEDTAPSTNPSTAVKYVFVLIWSLIPSNPFHGPFPYANTSGRERERESERVAECGWGSIRGGNRMTRCVFIKRFNWIVLHQCQEVSWCVCRGLCSFWLRAWLSFFSPTASQYLAGNKVFLRFQSQTIGERRETQSYQVHQGRLETFVCLQALS